MQENSTSSNSQRNKALAFYSNIIVPTLRAINVNNPDLAALLLGTAIQESDLIYRDQQGGGTGTGLYQVEIATHNDTWDNYLIYRPEWAELVTSFLSSPEADKIIELRNNDRYATVIAYLKYRRTGMPIPSRYDVPAMARLWKDEYNTGVDENKFRQFIEKWNIVIGDTPLP